MGFMQLRNPDQHTLPVKFTSLIRYSVRRAPLVLFTGLLSSLAICQNYPVAAIPDSLKENADIVIRLEEKVYEIKYYETFI